MSASVITASANVLVAVLMFILNQFAQARQDRRRTRLGERHPHRKYILALILLPPNGETA